MTMPDTAHILAIDLGTSGPKVALVRTDGRVRACVIDGQYVGSFASGHSAVLAVGRHAATGCATRSWGRE